MAKGSRKCKLLNGNELIKETELLNEIEPKILNHGLKAKFLKNTPEEISTIKSYQDDLRRLISTERVSRKHDLSTAYLENGQIKIIKRTGKWNLFGTSNYLDPHEALYLMEINRLEIYQDSVIVSLEKAYNLFFRTKTDLIDNNKLTREEYIIYSHLMRSGCTIQKYKNEESTKQSNVDNEQQPLKQLYTWNYLYELLGHQKQTIPSQSIDNCLYNEIKSSMDDIVKKITMRSPSSSTATHETINYLGKRKADVKPKEVLLQKKNSVNPSPEYFGNGALNDFMIGSDFQNFKSIFSQLDVIKLSSLEDCNDDHVTDSLQKLSFCFDLWVDGSYKKSDIRKPNYRIVVLRSDQRNLPQSQCIINLYKRQIHKSAIILIYVNEDLSFHAYIYRFTSD